MALTILMIFFAWVFSRLGRDFNFFLNPNTDKLPSVTFAPQVSS